MPQEDSLNGVGKQMVIKRSDHRELNIAFASFVIICLNTLNKVPLINNRIKG